MTKLKFNFFSFIHTSSRLNRVSNRKDSLLFHHRVNRCSFRIRFVVNNDFIVINSFQLIFGVFLSSASRTCAISNVCSIWLFSRSTRLYASARLPSVDVGAGYRIYNELNCVVLLFTRSAFDFRQRTRKRHRLFIIPSVLHRISKVSISNICLQLTRCLLIMRSDLLILCRNRKKTNLHRIRRLVTLCILTELNRNNTVLNFIFC